jgi:hypothetical protein
MVANEENVVSVEAVSVYSQGWECRLVLEHLPSICEALGSIPTLHKKGHS